MKIYIARRGDSLYSIAKANASSVQELAAINELSDPARLSIGQAIVIPDGARPTAETEVNGYAYPNISERQLAAVMPQLTYLCPFSWRIDALGGITPVEDSSMISAAWEGSCAPLLTLMNIGTNGGFSSDIAHSIFSDAAAQNALAENTLAALRSRGYYGVNLNIEYVQPYDREGYNAFLKRMSETLHANGYMLSSAIAPKTSDDQYGVLYTAHDYAAHGQYCDRVSPPPVGLHLLRAARGVAGERDAQGAVLRGYENAAVEDPARLFKLRLQLAAAVEAGAGGAGYIQRRGGLACCKRFCADTF